MPQTPEWLESEMFVRLSLDGGTDHVAPFHPRAVVILDARESQEVLEDEPSVARSLAGAVVDNDGPELARLDALTCKQRFQLVEFLERSIIITALVPRHVPGAGNMSSALRRFG